MAEISLHNYEAFLLDHSEGNLDAADTAALQAFLILHPELDINLDDLALPELAEELITIDFKHDLKKNESDFPDELLLNYLEGTITPGQKAAFEKELQHDAELAKNLAQYKKTILPFEAVSFEHKAGLFKTDDDLVLNNSVIAFVEGQLSPSEKAGFESDLKTSAALQKELNLVLKTKVQADASVVYSDKEALKKENKVIALFSFRTVMVMAAAILLLIGLVVVFNQFNAEPVVKKQMADKTPPVRLNDVRVPVKALKNASFDSAQTSGAPGAETHRVKSPLNAGKVRQVATTATASASQKETVQPVQPIAEPTVTVARTDQTEKRNAPKLNEEAPVEHLTSFEKNNTADSSAFSEEPNLVRQTLLASVEDTDDLEKSAVKNKKSFWDRAVQLAKGANKLGVKSVDGVEKPNKSYFLSFNSFSVEKK